MKVKQLSATNFKGRDFSFKLGDVSLVIADNFAGKTSIPMALRLGLSGYLPPPIGKAAGSIYKLAGNPNGEGTMAVSLELDNGRTVTQRWTKDASGKVSTEGGVAADLVMPELLMEPRLFFGKTGAERVKAIFDACDMRESKFGPETIRSRLVSVIENPAAVCEATLDAVEKLIASEFNGTVPLQKAAESLLVKVNESRKQAAAAAKQASGAFAAFRTKVQGDRPKDVSEDLLKAREVLAGLAAKRQTGNLESLRSAVKTAERGMAMIAGECQNPVMPAGEFLAVKVKQLGEDLAGLSEVEPYDATVALEDLNGDYVGRTAELAEVQGLIAEAEAQLATVARFELCAKCAKKIVAPTKALLKQLQERQIKVGKVKDTLRQKMAEEDAKQKAWDEYCVKKASLDRELSHATGLLTQWETYHADWEEANLRLQASDKADPKLESDITRMQAEVKEWEQKDAAHQQYKRDLARRDELERDLLENQCRADVYKRVMAIITDEQASASEWAFNKVLAVARHFTDGLLNSPLEFVDGDLGRRVSKLDKDGGSLAPVGSWISHETMSGTEQALAYIGFSVALCQDAPVKVVIVDDVIVAPERKRAMVGRFLELVAKGVIDQAIVVDVDAKDYTDKKALTIIKAG